MKLSSLLGFLDYYGVALRSEPREVTGGWQLEIECPWADEHSTEARRDTVVSFIAGLGNGFHCLHSHCLGRHWREFRAEMERRNPGFAPYYGKLPAMTHSKIARAFVDSHDDFVRLYDKENATGVWIPGKRWALGDPGDALLRKSIRRYLDELHERYTVPEPGQKDPRRPLQQAAFVSGVLAEVKPWLPPNLAPTLTMTRPSCLYKTARLRIFVPESSAICSGRIVRRGASRLCPSIFQRHGGIAFAGKSLAETMNWQRSFNGS